MKITTKHVLLSAAILASASVQAAEVEAGWQATVTYGQYKSDVSRADVLSATGQPSSALIDFQDSAKGFTAGLGYQFSNGWLVELGYRDQGKVENTWVAEVLDGNEFQASVENSLPSLAGGPYAEVNYVHPISDDFHVLGSFGFMAHHQDVQSEVFVERGGERALAPARNNQDENGIDMYIGVGMGYDVSEQITLGLNLERFALHDDKVTSVNVGVTYHF